MTNLEIGETTTVTGDSGTSYEITRHDGSYFCSCRAWKFQRRPPTERTCKHIDALLGASSEESGGRGRLDPAALKTFALGGAATITIENTKTSSHQTYRLRRKKADRKDESAPIFVSVLTGSNNDSFRDYSFLGTVWVQNQDGSACPPRYHFSPRSKIDRDSYSAQGAELIVDVVRGDTVPGNHLTFWHEGRCCFCGLKLTTPDSVAAGYGPDCATQRGLPYGKTSARRAPVGASEPRLDPVEPKTFPEPVVFVEPKPEPRPAKRKGSDRIKTVDGNEYELIG